MPRRFVLTQQQERRSRDLSILSNARPVQKGLQRPAHDLGSVEPVSMFLGKRLTRLGKRCLIQIIQTGSRDELGAPVLSHGLLANFVLLVQAKGAQAFSGSGVVMSLPGDRNPARGGRYFKQQNPAVR